MRRGTTNFAETATRLCKLPRFVRFLSSYLRSRDNLTSSVARCDTVRGGEGKVEDWNPISSRLVAAAGLHVNRNFPIIVREGRAPMSSKIEQLLNFQLE